ncbi:MAG: VWA domain-containing protein [Lewinellaceae bacterium]|nr:VWA domain-containing protein [Lewinellaceae bacterium]MCB9286747.1 VWA domain-containing protein [Lewinellaceae bacterium]
MKKLLLYTLSLALALAGCTKEEDLGQERNYTGLSATSDGGFYTGSGNINFSGSGETYNEIVENPFILVEEEPTSTFSIDADGASFSNVRRFLNNDQLPPVDAIRTEELVNYFNYDYEAPAGAHPIALNGEVSSCPWAPEHRLVRIGIKGKELPAYPASNMVLLIDVSGSMKSGDKLDLLKESFKLFVDELSGEDRLAIVTYAGQAGLLLPSTPGSEKAQIKSAIDKLGAGGSTAGAEGIITAYQIAQENFIQGGNNRVLLGTDGDFNVGPSSQEELVSLIEEKRDFGIFLTVLGVGTGNLNDAMLEQLADNGNGTYEYIDNLEQAKKVFIYEFGKFYTVAKDVKVQVDFNPSIVYSYRLIGYENRLLENEDFEDDQKDAGEIGAGQSITALYEIVPASGGSTLNVPAFSIDFRYKHPDEGVSALLNLEVLDEGLSFAQASENMRFAAAVASFGLLLRDSEYKGETSCETIRQWAGGAVGFDPFGFRQEFLQLVEKAGNL